jgi:hypothetical protein
MPAGAITIRTLTAFTDAELKALCDLLDRLR